MIHVLLYAILTLLCCAVVDSHTHGSTIPLIIHCKKRFAIFPSLVGMSLIKLSLGRNKPRESLVSDIPATDGKIVNLSYSVCIILLVSFWGQMHEVFKCWSVIGACTCHVFLMKGLLV
jgi:hypothetical protein